MSQKYNMYTSLLILIVAQKTIMSNYKTMI